MIKRMHGVILASVVLLMTVFMGFGYAALSDTLSLAGSADVLPPNLDEVVITSVTAVSQTVTAEDNYVALPTNLGTTFSGTAGQTVVYQIKAHNFSETDTYIYTGIRYSQEYADVMGKMTVSASMDKENADPLPDNAASNHTQGTPVGPGEDFVFYVTYTLTDRLENESLLINYAFKPVVYHVTYMADNEIYAVDYVTDNSVAYTVRSDGPPHGSLAFAGWINTNADIVTSYPAGNTNDYTLTAKWDDIYVIIFSDAHGNVIYEETFTSSSTKLSDEGQAIVDAALAEMNANAEKDIRVEWSEYSIAGAKEDIMVRALYSYSGYLNLVPVDAEPADGIIDYYRVKAEDTLPDDVIASGVVELPGYVGGIPVREVERITNEAGDSDWNNYANSIKTIIVGEGTETLEHNSLSYTPKLANVYLPSTLKTMGKNAFSRNDIFGNDKKVLTIHFNGTKAEWKALVANSHADWDGGLKDGSVVQCTNGSFELEKSLFSHKWVEK